MNQQQIQQTSDTRMFMVDAATHSAKSVASVINSLTGVIHVEAPLPYTQDPLFCQMTVLAYADMTECQLDRILHTCNVEYMGVIEMTRH